ncbi:hypothetical protein C8Q79DRAFT_685622 [Trametes meyenii]|nr:hypothetical protein C8Q79DRAFT_685622 [Trametes meyenii]
MLETTPSSPLACHFDVRRVLAPLANGSSLAGCSTTECHPPLVEFEASMASRSAMRQLLAAPRGCTTFRGYGLAYYSATTRLMAADHLLPQLPKPASIVGVTKALQDASPKPTLSLFRHDFSLADRVALVTGGNSGLGLEGALAFVEAGARVVYCVDICDSPSVEWLKVREYAARMDPKIGEGRLEYVRADVRDQEGMWKVGQHIGDKEGRLDVCLVGAGISGEPGDCLSVTGDAFQKVLDVNLRGMLFTAQAAGKQMVRFGRGGSIVFVSSLTGHQAIPDFPLLPYSVAKSGVHQMTRSFACELAPHGIRANSISPGFLKTPFVNPLLQVDPQFGAHWGPMGRHGEPHEFRGIVVFLASDASSYCTGTDILLDGGQHG